MGNSDKRPPSEEFRSIFEAFGKAISEVFDDPELKEKAKELGDSIADSAQAFGSRFKDEDVKEKFKEVGKAAERFGESVARYFNEKKGSGS